MPFPLAHPAAVLQLRRLCPSHLSFPALMIGSLTPDMGYLSEHFRLAEVSHRLFPGSFCFCLPVGFLMLVAFYLVRSHAVRLLPARYRHEMLLLCERPAGSPVWIVVSLLIGAWTHIFLDSITHQDGWLVTHLAFLRSSLPWLGHRSLGVYEVLYYTCTFLGVAWLAIHYLRWLEARNSLDVNRPWMKRVWALLLASGTVLIAEASRAPHKSLEILPAAIFTFVLVIAFLWGTDKWFGMRRR
jgi:hypothetical protein